MGCFSVRRSSTSRRTGSKGSSPMALTARQRVCEPCFQGRAWAPACATRSTSSRRNWRLSHPLYAKSFARSSTPYGTGHDNAKACACLHSASGYVTLPTMSPARRGRPMESASGAGFRRRKRVGVICSLPPTGMPIVDAGWKRLLPQWVR
jgi:hypothetical protein